ncbi:MAG: hypothetical protein CMA40_04320 [Euryarchaeota archaeon]|nr:hypothetical protein [Euryarchaeota archaeon]
MHISNLLEEEQLRLGLLPIVKLVVMSLDRVLRVWSKVVFLRPWLQLYETMRADAWRQIYRSQNTE